VTEGGHPLHVRPVTRPQMAALFAMVERLDDAPSNSMPPPGDELPPSPPSSTDEMADRTLADPRSIALHVGPSDVPPPFDGFETSLPPSSARDAANGATNGSSNATVPPSSGSANGASVLPPANEMLGRVVAGKYRLEAMIGSGSTAAVYRAMHVDLRRPYAVKVLHAQNRGEMQFVKRFKGEALAASRLEHANVTRVIDFGQEKDGLLYLVMELIVGKSLEALLTVSGRLPQRKVLDIAVQACSALARAHDEGIIHRDVKPENIMLVAHRDDDGNPCDLVKVCDFGMAKLREPDPEQGELTVAGMVCGSPAYMSPEQSRGDALDARTDVYSLGVTLFESLTGRLPHEADELAVLFAKKALEEPRRPSSYVPEIDPLVEDIVMRALATDPARRHASARVLREELRAALDQLEEVEESSGTLMAD